MLLLSLVRMIIPPTLLMKGKQFVCSTTIPEAWQKLLEKGDQIWGIAKRRPCKVLENQQLTRSFGAQSRARTGTPLRGTGF